MSTEASNVIAASVAHTPTGFEFRRGPSQSSQRAPTPIHKAHQTSEEDFDEEHEDHQEDDDQDGTPRPEVPRKGKEIATSSEEAAPEVHYYAARDPKQTEIDTTAQNYVKIYQQLFLDDQIYQEKNICTIILQIVFTTR